MKRVVFAGLLAAIAAGAAWHDASPAGAPIRDEFRGWLAANALPVQTEEITAIEMSPPAKDIRPLDAALVLRAVLRYAPRAIVFLDPIGADADPTLLASKLSEAKIPVVLTANKRLEPLPAVAITAALPPLEAETETVFRGDRPAGCALPVQQDEVLIAARQGVEAVASNVVRASMLVDAVPPQAVRGRIPGLLHAGAMLVPASAGGRAKINSLTLRFVKSIEFDQLMLRTERSEQGAISVDLDMLFRGRLVAIQNAGENGALGLAALRNRLAEASPPAGMEWLCVLLAASLPWWGGRRLDRALLALGVACVWALLALAIYQEFRIPLPLFGMMLLPLLALVPPGLVRKRRK